LLPAPAFDALTHVQGRVLQPASPCGGGRSNPGGFVLTVRVDGMLKDLRLSCNEELRMVAVGGTEVEMWLEERIWPRATIFQVWAAKVDGHPVVRYDDSVDFHNRTPQRLRQAYAVAFLIECVMVYGLLCLLRFVLTATRRGRKP
jgi:hypothetical protein